MKNATPFRTNAGSTTVTYKKVNGSSTPKMKIATDKKMNPDNNVPRPTSTVDAIKLEEILLKDLIIA